jgi:hypothetical protein
VLVVVDGDLVAEEPGRARAGVGDQSLVLRQLQLELLAQERRKTLLDLFGLDLRPDEPEEMIIGLCRGPGYADPTAGCPGRDGVRGS